MYRKICKMMRTWLCLVLVLPTLLPAQTIRSVRVEQDGIGRIDPEFVLAHTRIEVGDVFQANAAARDVRRLLDTGRFTKAEVSVVTLPDNELEVVLRVKPRMLLVGRPAIVGASAYSVRRVRNWLDLKEGALVDDQIAAVALQRVLDEYRKRHYREATGSWAFTVLDARRGTAALVFTLEEGSRSAIRRIKLEGNDAFGRSALRQALRAPHPLNPVRWFVPKRFDPRELDEITASVRNFYLDQGYLDVDVTHETGDMRRGRYARFRIQEGQLYRVGRIDVRGAALFESGTLAQMVLPLTGKNASLSGLDQAADRLQAYYGDRGYIDTRVRPILIPDLDAQLVDVEFRITEGELVRLRHIDIRGNSRTRDKVIRREIIVQPGEIYNRSRVERSERRLRNLGFFDTAFARTVPTLDDGTRDLVFEVSEKRTGQFMMGVGFSSVDNVLGFMELSQGNFDLFGWPYFTGGGQKLRLRAQAGSRRRDYELSFVEPWFLDRQLSFGLDLYRRERSFTEYDLKRTGAAVSLGRSLPFASRINFEYMIEKSVVTDVSDTNTYFHLDTFDFAAGTGAAYRFESEEDRLKSAFTISLVQDVRDNPFVPTRGHRINLFYTVAGGPFGGDIDMFHTGIRHAVYAPLWFRHVLSLRTRAEFVDTFGDTDVVPLAERLFVGGGRTIRGFRFRDVGPKVIRPLEGTDRYRHRPFGGVSLFVANLEYTIPIVPNVRLAGFYDTGNVWADHFELDFENLASSAGVGLRFDLPGFPIRIDRAWVVERDDQFSSEDTWNLWIGYDF